MTTPQSIPLPSDERRYQLLIESVSDYAIYMLDAQGFIASWNSGGRRIKGYDAAEVIGQHFSLFFTDDDRKRGLPNQTLASARKWGRHESEGWRVRKGGSRFWALAVLDVIRDESGVIVGFAKITRDMTERRAAQLALIESERRFRMLVDGVVDYAIYMLDPSGIVTHWNTGAERIKGYKADEIVGQHFSRFYRKDERAAGLPARALETAVREGRFEAEGWRVRKDGSEFWASVVIDVIRGDTGELVGFAKITRDATERQKAHRALAESERQFRLLVTGVTDYALYMLDPNGIITNWNAGAQSIKGYKSEEIVGQHFSKFFSEADRAAGFPARALATAAREGKFESEGWRVRKDGSLFWASAVIDAIRDENGQLVGFAKVTRDISERRVAQEALRKAQEQLANSQKMEALGQLTGGIAHDFNNLLMIMSGHVQMLKKLLADQPKGLRAAESIELAARRGEKLTRQLLAFSRRQRLSPRSVDVKSRLETFREMLANSARDDVALRVGVPSETWPVQVDVNELELALVNITVNARDAMPDGGTISITARNHRLQPGDLGKDLDGDFVAISISDDGVGIPEDILPKIFDPFFTTKEVDKGTGLGLSQVHGFAHHSGGTVTIESLVNSGTSVTLYLPRAASAPSRQTPSDECEFEFVGGNILVVEDNPEVAHVSAMLLEQLGYTVRIANNAEAALQQLSRDEKIDLVFSDIVMAGEMDGIGLARAVRERHPGLPVLLATGYSKAAEGAQGEFSIMRKPFQIAELGRAVAKLLGHSRQEPIETNLVHLDDVKKIRTSKADSHKG